MVKQQVSESERHEANALRVLQVIVICFSLLFVAILWGGYSTLFSRSGTLFATLASAVLSILAWSLGRYVGMHEGGIARKGPMFALLLLLSSAGVFNWMMMTLEGKTIFLEAVSASEDVLTKLDVSARKNVVSTTLSKEEDEVKTREAAFLAEVKNPLNCGYGPEARQRLEELQRVLPDLRLPSPPAKRRAAATPQECQRRSEVYKPAIDDAWDNSVHGKQLTAVRLSLADILTGITQQKLALSTLRDRAETEGTAFIIGDGRLKLEAVNQEYKKLLGNEAAYAPDPDLPSNINLTTISRLGEWSQIITVMVSRLDHISTYVYLLLAVFMDSMLVYLFSEYHALRRRQPRQVVTTAPSVTHLGAG